MQAPAWIVAGNYHVIRNLVWTQAEVLIWLDYSFPGIFWQLARRTLQRWWYQEELWNGNREKFWWHLKIWSEESLLYRLFKTYWSRKREYPLLPALPEHRHLKRIRFKNPIDADEWLETFLKIGA